MQLFLSHHPQGSESTWAILYSIASFVNQDALQRNGRQCIHIANVPRVKESSKSAARWGSRASGPFGNFCAANRQMPFALCIVPPDPVPPSDKDDG